MDYEMETLIQALVIQINMVWNQFHEIIHELIRYAHALLLSSNSNLGSKSGTNLCKPPWPGVPGGAPGAPGDGGDQEEGGQPRQAPGGG